MLATSQSEIPRGEGWTYEPKWDGFRTIVAVGEDGGVQLVSRDGRPLGRYFPEIVELVAEQPPGPFVADGELLAEATALFLRMPDDQRAELELRYSRTDEAFARVREAVAEEAKQREHAAT